MLYTILYTLFGLGILVSAYAVYAYYQAQKDANYKTICDLSDRASCTKAFTSEYGKHFGIPNGYFGIGFYLIMIAITSFQNGELLLWLSGTSLIASLYLAYLLTTKVKAICLDCISIYAINITCFAIIVFLNFYA